MERFAGRVGLVTGGSAGIGLAIAGRLIGEGAEVTVCGRRAEVLAAAREALGERASTQQLDVADASALQALIREIQGRHGRFDFLVNNA
ncbi:MAG: SDR family NAD(P)-dependent oxidoreductase, partial [Gammaproteobacteria bacterium]|nr:SDR family NAD(P)-dependent oxidoreductase [Gammaproteobacteria bacterium]